MSPSNFSLLKESFKALISTRGVPEKKDWKKWVAGGIAAAVGIGLSIWLSTRK
jgi:hypothetical protein